MKPVWLAAIALAAASAAHAQSTTIYKHVDENGRTTYSNRPIKGAQVMELEPLTTIPGTAGASAAPSQPLPQSSTPILKGGIQPASLVVLTPEAAKAAQAKAGAPVPAPKEAPRTTVAIVQPPIEYLKREDDKRAGLEADLARETQSLEAARKALAQEQQNPALVAAVRAAQQATDPSPAQLAEFRLNIDKASGRIRGLQATVAEHEKSVEALRKELGALKP